MKKEVYLILICKSFCQKFLVSRSCERNSLLFISFIKRSFFKLSLGMKPQWYGQRATMLKFVGLIPAPFIVELALR